MRINWKRLILPNIPYVFLALFGTKLGQAVRLAPGPDPSGKLLHLIYDGASTHACLAAQKVRRHDR